jgi:DNA-binding response OmpR family regulator
VRPMVLVIEDEEVVGIFLRETLLDAGFSVHLLSQGSHAVDVLASKYISAAIIDVSLPDIMGDELVAQLRVRWPNLPILLTTTEHCRSSITGDEHLRILSKPFDAQSLHQELRALAIVPSEHALWGTGSVRAPPTGNP